MSEPASTSTGNTSGRRNPDCNCDKSEEPTTISWQLNLGTAFEVTLAAGVRMYDIGRHGLTIAPTGERAVFSNNALTFTGTSVTWLALSIRVPAGNIRILWDGSDLVIDGRYLLADDAFAIRYRPIEQRPPPPVIFIDCFGQSESRLHMRHHNCVYVLRFESDYPVMIVPMSEYLMLQVSWLRDQRASIQRHRRGPLSSNEPTFSPRTPSTVDTESETESDMDHIGSRE